MTQNEILGRVVPKALMLVAQLRNVQRIEISAAQCSHNRVAQTSEDVRKGERQPTCCLQQVIWQSIDIAIMSLILHNQINTLPTIPVRAES